MDHDHLDTNSLHSIPSAINSLRIQDYMLNEQHSGELQCLDTNAQQPARATNDGSRNGEINGCLAGEPSMLPDKKCQQYSSKLHSKIRSWRHNGEDTHCWFVLLVSIVPAGIIKGIDFVSFSIFYVSLAEHFQNETRSSIGIAVAIKESLQGLFGIVTSVVVTRFGCRVAALAGGILMSIGMLLSAFTPNIFMLYFTQGVIIGIGTSLSWMPSLYYTQKVFHQNRALANGIALMGNTIGNMSGPPIINWLVKTYGWRGSLVLQAAITSNLIPFSLLLALPTATRQGDTETNIPSEIGAVESSKVKQTCQKIKIFVKEILDFSLFKNGLFVVVCLVSLMDRFNLHTFIQHITSRVVSLNINRTDAAFVLSTFAISVVPFRTMVTILSNMKCANRALIYAGGCLVGGISSIVLVMFKVFIGQVLGAVINGAHIGTTNTLTYVVLVDLFGIQILARSMALHDIVTSIAALGAPPIGGYLYDVTHSYDATFILSGCLAVLGAALLFIAISLQTCRSSTISKKHTSCVPDGNDETTDDDHVV